MEIIKYIKTIKRKFLRLGLLLVCIVFVQGILAQPHENGVSIFNGKVFLTLNREIVDGELAVIVHHYELEELPLKDWLKQQNIDKITKYGWNIEHQENEWFTISRPVESIGDLGQLEKKILLASAHNTGTEIYPEGVSIKKAGFNRLRKAGALMVNNGVATIFLEGYKNAGMVKLAGNFTAWEKSAVLMKRSSEGWIVSVPLSSGKYFYKFIVDGNWIIHKDNLQKENDGEGNINSVFYMPSHTFFLKGYANASKVVVAGTFNNWAPDEAQMKKTTTGWELPFYLPEGTYSYRYVVNGKWMADPDNPNKTPNEYSEYNSVLCLGKPYVFRLEGFQNAKKVELAGSFNNWRKDEFKLQKIAGGWEMPYTLGSGNYEYYYLVDGIRVGLNPPKVNHSGYEKFNFSLVIAPNYTFVLKGYPKATSVFLSGSFNNWSETGFPMKLENGQWVLKVNLPAGKQTYKFVVDGKWITDPSNKQWEQNEHNSRNSVLWFE